MWEWLKSVQERLTLENTKKHVGTVAIVVIVAFVFLLFSIPKVLNSSSSSNAGYLTRQAAVNEEIAARTAGANLDSAVPLPASAPAAEPVSQDNQPPVNMLLAASPTVLYKPQIIKTANLMIRVENILSAMKRLEGTTFKFGGVVTDQNVAVSGPNDSFRQGSLTIRIPKERLDGFLNDIGSLGTILTQTISGRDVGMEIVDTEARVKNLRVEETSLQALMGRSGKIPDILEVEHELSRVRGEIEQNQGRLNYLRQQVAYSTVTVSLTEQTIATPTQGKPGLATIFVNAIQSALGSLYDLCIWLIELVVWLCLGFLPRLLLLCLVGWVLWKLFGICRSRFRKKANSGNEKD